MARESVEWANERVQRRKSSPDPFGFMNSGRGSAGRFELETVDPGTLGEAVVRWCGQGNAISFGLSGDGGAFGCHLIVDGRKRSKWFSEVRELEDWLTTVPGPADPAAG